MHAMAAVCHVHFDYMYEIDKIRSEWLIDSCHWSVAYPMYLVHLVISF